MIIIPNNFIASTTEMIRQSFSDLKTIIIIIFGVIFGFFVIMRLVDLIKNIMGK